MNSRDTVVRLRYDRGRWQARSAARADDSLVAGELYRLNRAIAYLEARIMRAYTASIDWTRQPLD